MIRNFLKRSCVALAILLALFPAGCVSRPERVAEPIVLTCTFSPSPVPETKAPDPTAVITPNLPESLTPAQTAVPMDDAGSNSYTELPTDSDGLDFFAQIPHSYYFGSGAGGWNTIIDITDDGTFTGNYHDWSAMGPDGIMGYQVECNFYGQFGNVAKIADHIYTMEVIDFHIEGTEGERYLDSQGTTHETTLTPHGFNDASLIYVYCPGVMISDVNDKFISWYSPNGWQDLYNMESKTLSKYALYNYYGECGFFEWVPPTPYGFE